MARNTDSSEPGRLVPITEVAARTGVIDDIVWGKLDPADVRRDWDNSYCVEWSKAKALYDEIHGAMEAANRENARLIAEQQDREHFERTWPVRAYEAASKRLQDVPAVQSFGPGDQEPGWADESGSTVVQIQEEDQS